MPNATFFLRSTKPIPADATLEERFAAAVFNTGNYFFEEALEQHLDDISVVYSFADLPEKVGTLVLSMSNFISPSTNLDYFHHEIAKRDVARTVMVGAGAQANDYSEEISLQEGTVRFIKLLSERSVSIGVRGYYTADVLSKMGITNVDVIGCPTAFWVDRVPVEASHKPPLQLAAHCTPTGNYRDKVGGIFQHAMKHNASYIIQSEQWMMPIVSEAFKAKRDELLTDYNISYYGKYLYSPKDFEVWLKAKGLIYFGMQEWIDAMKGFDFVYGSRFHGNMAALQAGVPALNMPFDTRTRELCEYLNLPHIALATFSPDMSPAHLMDMADLTLYNKTYSSRRADYRSFLERNGLKTRNLEQEGVAASTAERNIMALSLKQLAEDFTVAGITEEEFLRAAALRVRKDRDRENRSFAETARFDLLQR